jgi:hypothetical protein
VSTTDFLDAPSNSHAREELFNHRLLYDLKLAAFGRGYHLQTYYSDVDHDGFDVIFDDGDNLRKIQLKTVGGDAATNSWDIHRCILRPLARNYEELGFDFVGNWGVEGGVVLIDHVIDKSDSLQVSYFYTDIYIINGIALGLIPRHGNTKNAANNLRDGLQSGGSREKISVAKGLFVKVASPQHLLCILGMHSTLKYSGWQRRIRSLSSEEWGPKGRLLENVLGEYRKEMPFVMKDITGFTDF